MGGFIRGVQLQEHKHITQAMKLLDQI